MYFQEGPKEYKVKGVLYIPNQRKQLKVYNQITEKKGLNILPLIQRNLTALTNPVKYLGDMPQSYIIVGLWQLSEQNQLKVRMSSNLGVGINAENEIRHELNPVRRDRYLCN